MERSKKIISDNLLLLTRPLIKILLVKERQKFLLTCRVLVAFSSVCIPQRHILGGDLF